MEGGLNSPQIYPPGETQLGFTIETGPGTFTLYDRYNRCIHYFSNIAEYMDEKGKTLLSMYVNIGMIEPNSLGSLNLGIGMLVDNKLINSDDCLPLSQIFEKLFYNKKLEEVNQFLEIRSNAFTPFITGVFLSAVLHGSVFGRINLSKLENIDLAQIQAITSSLLAVRNGLYVMGRTKKFLEILKFLNIGKNIFNRNMDLDDQNEIIQLLSIAKSFDFSKIINIITNCLPENLKTDPLINSITAALMKELSSGLKFSSHTDINNHVLTTVQKAQKNGSNVQVHTSNIINPSYERIYLGFTTIFSGVEIFLGSDAICPHFGGNRGQCPIEH